jgi:hypothetical protein
MTALERSPIMAHEFRTTLFVFSHGGHLYSVQKAEAKMTKPIAPPSFYLEREDGREMQIDTPMMYAIKNGLSKLESEPPREAPTPPEEPAAPDEAEETEES